ncbi:MAG TPA: peptidylprolyl isomerase [Pseudomonadales bacterium]|nr:peptidylprolyl isomerase [Pseudomonadales bacterium]
MPGNASARGVSMHRWLGWRPLHFVVVGLVAWWVAGPQLREVELHDPIVLAPAQIAALHDGWIAVTGQAPDATQMRALEQREIDDEILFREALARGLQRSDAVVRQRLLLNMRFLDPKTQASDEQLLRQAMELGLHRNDVVVRRRLVQVMEFSFEAEADHAPPSEAELARMYEQQRGDFLLPARWRLRHMYFSKERRGRRAGDDARATLALLERSAAEELADSARGDPFLGGLTLPLLDEQQLAAQFGAAFAHAVAGCELQRWCGPLRSSYGEHLVLIEESVPVRELPFDDPEVQRRLESEVFHERARDALARSMVELRRRYGVQS